MHSRFLTEVQTGNVVPYGFIVEEKNPPVQIPEGEWVDIESLRVSSLPNGTYVVNGSILYSSGSTSKSNLFRVTINGVESGGISAEIKDTTDAILYDFRAHPFVSEGVLDILVEGMQEEGGGSASLEVKFTQIDYEKKSDKRPIQLTGNSKKHIVHGC